jgi:tetratricopeptide (TPR) repeat protein
LAPPAELYERAVTSAAMSFHESAIEILRDVTVRAPDHAGAWRKLGECLRLAGQDVEAAAARATAGRIGENPSKWPKATGERSPTKLEKAERKLHDMLRSAPQDERIPLLRECLFTDPLDVAAMRLLAQHEWTEDDPITAQQLLERALDLSPGYIVARRDLADLLLERRAHARALIETRKLMAQMPRDLHIRSLHTDVVVQLGMFDEAIDLAEGMIRDNPNNLKYRLAYAGALHFVGRREDSLLAYRACLEIDPASGQAYWGIADLKGNFLTDADVTAIRAYLAGHELDDVSRQYMNYALAPYLERAGNYAASFAAYAAGAASFRASVAGTTKAHNVEFSTDRVRRLKQVFSAANLAARARPAQPAARAQSAQPPARAQSAQPPAPAQSAQPNEAAAQRDTPIFVVGMPRAGSTLVEQILASHSMVEGTRELPVIGDIVRDLTVSRAMITEVAYPEVLLDLTPEELAALGARCLEHSKKYRHTDRPCFIDKRPWNWLDAGLIHLMLPNAKIIDVRREPMAACFAMFKQLLPPDAAFSYDLTEVGRYYNEYVSMMDHYERVLPGRIHFLQYERLVEDTETEIRRLLAYCGLPFEESCLRFWETDRAVSTPSAEQVRRPIFRDALQQWRKFEPWLGPLAASLQEPVKV